MPFFLANPYLWFAFAVALPIVLHLLHNQRPRPAPFGTVRFILKAMSQSRRSRRVMQCLLLFLRMLLILLLVLAFARPMFRTFRRMPGAHRTVLILLDSSASMQAMEGGASNFDHAKGIALQLMDSLSKGDKAAFLTPGAADGQGIFPPLSDLPRVRREIASSAAGFGAANWQEVLAKCLEQDNEALRTAEIHVISDFQGSRETWSIPSALREKCEKEKLVFFFTRAGRADVPDAGIARVEFSPPAIIATGDAGMNIRTTSSGGYPGEVTVQANAVGGQELSSATANADGVCSMTYSPASAQEEENAGTGFLSVPSDGYPANNRYYFSLPKADGIPALVVYGNSERDVFYLMRALRPAGKSLSVLIPQAVSWETFLSSDLSRFAMAFLCNPPALDGIAQERIEAMLRLRKSVAIFPGEQSRLEPARLRELCRQETLQCREEIFPKAERITLEKGPHSIAAGAAAIQPPPWHFPARRLWSFSEGGTPLLEMPGRGAFGIAARENHLFVFGATANRDWSDWPLSPLFLILAQELGKHSLGSAAPSLQATVGEPIAFPWDGPRLSATFGITYPDGENTLSTCQRNSPDDLFRIAPAAKPGFATVRADQTTLRIAVNIPESECALLAQGNDVLREGMGNLPLFFAGNFEELRKRCQEGGHGIPLWPWLLAAAFLLGIVEILLANRRSRQNLK